MSIKIDQLPKLFDLTKLFYDKTTYFWEFLFLDDSPKMKPNKYQRDLVWTTEQKISYIEYCLSGGINGKTIYLNRLPYNLRNELGYDYDIIDGQQRINAVKEFIGNKFKIFNEYYCSDLTSLSDRYCRFEAVIVDNYTLEEQIKFYVVINTTGTKHKDEEIKKALDMLK